MNFLLVVGAIQAGHLSKVPRKTACQLPSFNELVLSLEQDQPLATSNNDLIHRNSFLVNPSTIPMVQTGIKGLKEGSNATMSADKSSVPELTIHNVSPEQAFSGIVEGKEREERVLSSKPHFSLDFKKMHTYPDGSIQGKSPSSGFIFRNQWWKQQTPDLQEAQGAKSYGPFGDQISSALKAALDRHRTIIETALTAKQNSSSRKSLNTLAQEISALEPNHPPYSANSISRYARHILNIQGKRNCRTRKVTPY